MRPHACVMLVVLMGCQPLYGSKPEHLHTVEKKRKPPEAEVVVAPIKYVEDCSSNFQDDPKKNHPQPQLSIALVATGDTAMNSAERETDENKKVGLWRDAIDKYRNALIKDPYNIDATLALALAYDKLLRKGCALAMLKRLASLDGNQRWMKEANAKIDQISDNSQWFKGYRKDAMTAVGR